MAESLTRAGEVAAALAPIAAATGFGFRADLRAVDRPAAGWIALAELADPAGRRERGARIAAAAGGGAPARLPLVWEIEALAWQVGVLVGGSLIHGGELPRPGPATAWIRAGEDGTAEGLAIAADSPCAEAGPAAARALIGELAGAALAAEPPRSARVLWWHVGDKIADALIWCADAFDARREAIALADDLLAPGVPYSVPAAISPEGLARERRTCCLARRAASGKTCEGCPHDRRDERT